jgi:hypothetical protein
MSAFVDIARDLKGQIEDAKGVHDELKSEAVDVGESEFNDPRGESVSRWGLAHDVVFVILLPIFDAASDLAAASSNGQSPCFSNQVGLAIAVPYLFWISAAYGVLMVLMMFFLLFRRWSKVGSWAQKVQFAIDGVGDDAATANLCTDRGKWHAIHFFHIAGFVFEDFLQMVCIVATMLVTQTVDTAGAVSMAFSVISFSRGVAIYCSICCRCKLSGFGNSIRPEVACRWVACAMIFVAQMIALIAALVPLSSTWNDQSPIGFTISHVRLTTQVVLVKLDFFREVELVLDPVVVWENDTNIPLLWQDFAYGADLALGANGKAAAVRQGTLERDPVVLTESKRYFLVPMAPFSVVRMAAGREPACVRFREPTCSFSWELSEDPLSFRCSDTNNLQYFPIWGTERFESDCVNKTSCQLQTQPAFATADVFKLSASDQWFDADRVCNATMSNSSDTCIFPAACGALSTLNIDDRTKVYLVFGFNYTINNFVYSGQC